MTLWTDIVSPGRSSRKPARVSLLTWILDAGAIARQRRQLARLDDSQLADVDLTRDEALREARRPRWDAPGHWRF